MNIEREKVVYAARNGIPLVVKTYTLPADTETELDEILAIFLDELGQEAVQEHLSYCLKELTGNAKKANTKRVYFLEKGISIEDPDGYESGMRTFKSVTLGNIQHFLELQEKQELYIKVSFLIRDTILYLSVRNNVVITPKELTRVYDRVARSRAFETMAEALDEVLDDSEGAGLGIVVIILMLRKMGLSEKSFDLAQIGKETVVTLTIPMNAVRFERMSAISDEIIQVLDSLPPFPENLEQLLRLLSDPNVEFKTLAAHMSNDPALTADLIRYVNSAKFGLQKRIDNLQDAVRIVGIQGIKEQIYPYGAHKILEKYLVQQKKLWENATRTSFYAGELAKEFHFGRDALSLAQVAGILYNIGQIILSFLQPFLNDKILDFCKKRQFSVELFDELSQAVNPSEIGARIAEKWNFPEDLTQILRFQNHPQGATPVLQPVASAVHLAGSLVSVERDLLNYRQINSGVLRALKLDKLDSLQTAHDRMRNAFSLAGQNF